MVPHESELAKLTLTPDATKRLGIQSASCMQKHVTPHRVFGGELVTPPARSIIVVAPVGGVIVSPEQSAIPSPGSRVQAGDRILTLKPLLSPERDVPTPTEQVQIAGAKASLLAAQVTALGDVERSQAEVANASIILNRAKKLFADRAGSQRAVDDAQALLNVSSKVLEAAQERNTQLTKLLNTLESNAPQEATTILTLRAPVAGILRSLNASIGQQVVGGTALFEVLDDQLLWLRVPVFVDLAPTIRTDQPAKLSTFHTVSKTPNYSPIESVDVLPVQAPPTADPVASTVDLYFALDNRLGRFQSGQRVAVDLPLHGEQEASVVPASSVIYDIYGNTWVYVIVGENQYRRQRVAIRWIEGTEAVLERSIIEGALVVTDGVAELFGTEFGAGK